MTVRRDTVRIVLSLIAVFLAGGPWRLAAQPRWGEITPKGCLPNGSREWSAILWDIPRGQSWEAACEATGASVAGELRYPDRCVTHTNVWGVWEVADSQCPVTRPDPRLYADLNLRNQTRPIRSLRVEYILEHEERTPPDGLVQFVRKDSQILTAPGALSLYSWRAEPRLQAGAWRVRVRVWIAQPDGTERFEEAAVVREVPFNSGDGTGFPVYFSIVTAGSGYRIRSNGTP